MLFILFIKKYYIIYIPYVTNLFANPGQECSDSEDEVEVARRYGKPSKMPKRDSTGKFLKKPVSKNPEMLSVRVYPAEETNNNSQTSDFESRKGLFYYYSNSCIRPEWPC